MLKQIQANGTSLTVEDAGNGPAIVFLHAGVADRRMWDPQFDWLSTSFRVIRWDARGFGSTPHVPGPFSYAADVLAVMDALKVSRATLIGCSFGGSTAIRVGLDNPDRVARLVLIGTGLHGFIPAGPQPAIAKDIEAAEVAGDREQLLALEEKLWILGAARDEGQVDPTFLALCRDMLRAGLQPDNGATSQDRLTSDVGRVSELRMPVLLVVGDQDAEAIHDVARLLFSEVPRIHTKVISDSTHLPSLERPEQFNAILAGWLRRNVDGG